MHSENPVSCSLSKWLKEDYQHNFLHNFSGSLTERKSSPLKKIENLLTARESLNEGHTKTPRPKESLYDSLLEEKILELIAKEGQRKDIALRRSRYASRIRSSKEQESVSKKLQRTSSESIITTVQSEIEDFSPLTFKQSIIRLQAEDIPLKPPNIEWKNQDFPALIKPIPTIKTKKTLNRPRIVPVILKSIKNRLYPNQTPSEVSFAEEKDSNLETIEKFAREIGKNSEGFQEVFLRLLEMIGDIPNSSFLEKFEDTHIEEEELRNQLEFLQDEEVVNGLKLLGSLAEEMSVLLMQAVEQGNLEEVERIMFEQTPNLELKNEHGYTALNLAVKLNKYLIAEYLMELEADVNTVNNANESPLTLAIKVNSPSLVLALLDYGAEINTADERGWTPLITAAYIGNLEITKLLIERGADTKIKDNTGKTAFDRANDPNIRAVFVKMASVIRKNERRATVNPEIFERSTDGNRLSTDGVERNKRRPTVSYPFRKSFEFELRSPIVPDLEERPRSQTLDSTDFELNLDLPEEDLQIPDLTENLDEKMESLENELEKELFEKMESVLKEELSLSYIDILHETKSRLFQKTGEILKKIKIEELSSFEEVLKETEIKGFSQEESCMDIFEYSPSFCPKSLEIIKPELKTDLSNEVLIEEHFKTLQNQLQEIQIEQVESQVDKTKEDLKKRMRCYIDLSLEAFSARISNLLENLVFELRDNKPSEDLEISFYESSPEESSDIYTSFSEFTPNCARSSICKVPSKLLSSDSEDYPET